MSTVLIVEDEQAIANIIAFNLKRDGFDVLVAEDGIKGLSLALSDKVDLVLLDVMLPGMDGFEVLRRVREKSTVPVIMVTAREEERDKIMGLDNGADDYITKPFSVRELIARIKANMRRHGVPQAKSGAKEVFGPFTVDKDMQQISKNGVPLELTQREYDLLNYFFASPDKVVSREELMDKVWGYEYYGDLRAVDVAMRRLREKVEEDSANPEYIMTRRGVGYYIKF